MRQRKLNLQATWEKQQIKALPVYSPDGPDSLRQRHAPLGEVRSVPAAAPFALWGRHEYDTGGSSAH